MLAKLAPMIAKVDALSDSVVELKVALHEYNGKVADVLRGLRRVSTFSSDDEAYQWIAGLSQALTAPPSAINDAVSFLSVMQEWIKGLGGLESDLREHVGDRSYAATSVARIRQWVCRDPSTRWPSGPPERLLGENGKRLLAHVCGRRQALIKLLQAGYNMEQINPATGDEFDANIHQCTKPMLTADSRLHGRVAAVDEPGFRLEGVVVEAARVKTYQLSSDALGVGGQR